MADDADDDARGFPYEFELQTLLSSTIESYEDARSEYHALVNREADAQTRLELDRIDMAAKFLIQGVGDLASSDSVPRARRLLESWRGTGPADPAWERAFMLIQERISIDLGLAACDMLQQATDRFFRLVAVTFDSSPSPRTAKFLRRVSRCYLFGFDMECVALCRAVIDAELQAEIPTDDCVVHLGDAPGARPRRAGVPTFDLADRIAVARKTQRLTDNGHDFADEIRRVGNDMLHFSPAETVDAWAIIVKSLQVLRELDRSRRTG